MSIYDRFFKNRGRTDKGVDVSGVKMIPTKCPTCGMTGDFPFDPGRHESFMVIRLDSKTDAHVLECPYCRAGMLLCIREARLVRIEPFKEDSTDLLDAVARAQARLGQ